MMKASTMNSIILVFGLLLVSVCKIEGEDHTKTYPQKTSLGEEITCYKCEPGQYYIGPCSRDGGNSECKQCPEGQYNSHHTRAESCAICDTQCRDPTREQVDRNCSSLSNISCICKDGFYRVNTWPSLCTSHDMCPPGKGVKKIGNPYNNTLCEICLEGFYSGVASKTEGCKQCTKCSANETVLQECTSTNNTICTPKEKEKPKEIDIGLIIGLCVLGLATCISGAIFCIICCRKRGKECIKKNSKPSTSDSGHDDAEQPRGQEMKPLINGQHTNGVVPHDTQIWEGEKYLTKEDLLELAGDVISKDYPVFFRHLFEGDADKHIHEMEIDYNGKGVKEVIYQILKKWQITDKEKATKAKVLKVLEEVGRNDLANKYKGWNNCNVSETSEDKEIGERHS